MLLFRIFKNHNHYGKRQSKI